MFRLLKKNLRKNDVQEEAITTVSKDTVPVAPKVEDPVVTTVVVHDPLAARISIEPEQNTQDFVAATAQKPADPEAVIENITESVRKGTGLNQDEATLLDAVTFRETAALSDIVASLRTYGLAIFPSLYDAEQLHAVTQEYNDLMDNGEDLARGVDARADTPAASYALRLLRKSLPTERFSHLHALFGSDIIHEITKRVFMGQNFNFNDHLYAQWTDHTDAPASGVLHWDRQLTLKSWLYVTDGEDGFGAMRAGAGSNRWLRYLREDAMFNGLAYKSIDNSVAENAAPILSTGGPAGTFFLFVTDTAHGASPVAKGKRRNIIRAQSRPERIAQWAAWANKI